MEEIISTNVWKEISTTAKKSKRKSYVAVAYFGKGGAEMLPLYPGSILVVDASEGAVKSGQTSPDELLKLYKKGIKIYSYERLHAKVFVLGTRVFIGSTNVSAHSENVLLEAAFVSTDRKVVMEAKEFITDLAFYELGPTQLKKLGKIYRPPRFPGGGRISGRKGDNQLGSVDRLYVTNLETTSGYSDGYKDTLKEGRRTAQQFLTDQTRHKVTEFEWTGKVPFKVGDLVMQVVDKEMVYPPARVIHMRKWGKGSTFIFLEYPNRRGKRLRKIKELDERLLLRDGYRNANFTRKALNVWK